MFKVDLSELFLRLVKYMVEGLAVAVAAFYIPRRKMALNSIIMLAVTAAATLALLDYMAPGIGDYARHGAGFGIGLGLTGARLPFPVPAMSA